MTILIIIFSAIVGYPMFMIAVYLFSKGIFNQQKEFSELNLRRKSVAVRQKKKNLTHA